MPLNTATISDGTTDTEPLLVQGYDFERSNRTVFHQVPGSSSTDATLFPIAPRSGTMTLVYTTAATGLAAEELLKQPATFTLVDTDVPSANMDFLVEGLRLTQDGTRTLWMLAVGFREVTG